MADDLKKYISIINYDGVGLFIKDTEAHTAIGNLQTTVSGHTTDIGNLQTSVASNTSEIANIKSSITGAMHYIGKTSNRLGENTYEGPWTIDNHKYDTARLLHGGGSVEYQFIRNASIDTEYYISTSDVGTAYGFSFVHGNLSDSDAVTYSYIYLKSIPSEETSLTTDDVYYFDSQGDFKPVSYPGSPFTLKFTYYPKSANSTQLSIGSVAVYTGESKELEYVWGPRGWSEFGSTGSLKALAFKDSATVTFEAGTGSNFVTGFDTAPVAPSFTEGAFSAGTLPSYTEGTFSAGTLPSLGTATTGTFATEGVTVTYTEGTETLAFGIASTSSAVTAQGTFNAGTLPSKTADTFSAGTLPSKGADTFSAGTVPTLATAKALTASNTGTAS